MIDKMIQLAKQAKDAGVSGAAKVIAKATDADEEQTRAQLNARVHHAEIYTAESINAAEGYLEEHDVASKVHRTLDKVGDVADSIKQSGDKVADHFTNDHFDEQTAAIRDQLAKADDSSAGSEADSAAESDIVIDATKPADATSDDDKGKSNSEAASAGPQSSADQPAKSDEAADDEQTSKPQSAD